MSISVNKLSKNYGSQKAVDNISFNISRGEIVGFLGPNGAGKSTTMKMITGFLPVDEGSIQVCGIPVTENSIETKRRTGYLPEANPLYVDMYVREYLAFIANIHGLKNSKGTIEETIHTVGLSLESNKKISQLSKGYKQRVGLAAALVHNPDVLILDEPTSGLDPNQIIEIRELIKKLGKNKTVLFSSHIMQEVEAICDRVIIINKGIIVADDSLKNLQKGSAEMEIVSVEFREAIDIDILEKLSGSQYVKAIRPSSFIIQCSNADLLKQELLILSVQHKLNVIALQTETHDLEAVFKSLTS